MEKNYTSHIIGAAAILLSAIIISGCVSKTEPPVVNIESVPSSENMSFQKLQGSNVGVGLNYGFVSYTNTAGSKYIAPSNGITSFTFSDISGFAAPYDCVVVGMRKRDFFYFGTNVLTNCITFTVATNELYVLTAYVRNPPPPPTNGQVLTLKLQQN